LLKTSKKYTRTKKLLKADLTKKSSRWKYKTRYIDIKKYFAMINELVFDNKLSPFNKVYLKQMKNGTMGQVITYDWERRGTREYELHMLPFYEDKQEFANTLAHEMVHLYQMANQGDTGNHNALFYSYRTKLNRIGLDL
tara:strand:+ start:5925 stop:6341 length:417 start_codon:yes stop_codon:yes gene_type:complete